MTLVGLWSSVAIAGGWSIAIMVFVAAFWQMGKEVVRKMK